jgi:hypothetical protein
LVERNLAKVEVASSRLVSRSKFVETRNRNGSVLFCGGSGRNKQRRVSKVVMQRIANP